MIDIDELKEYSYDVIGAILAVKKELGPGLNEKVYQEGFAIELSAQGIPFEREKAIHPVYRGRPMDTIFYLDFFCKNDIIVELKAVKSLDKEHRTQLFNYMHIAHATIGLLVNFAPSYADIERYYYDHDENVILNSEGNTLRNRYDT